MILKDLPIDNKPREKALSNGIETLSDAELLAIIIRSGYKGKSAIEIGYDLISSFNGLTNLSNCEYSDLNKIKGLKKAKTLSLLATIEFSKRVNYKPLELKRFSSSKDIYLTFEPKLGLLKQEVCIVIYFNKSGNVIKTEEIFKGGSDYHLVHLPTIFRNAIKNNCKYFMLLHNHPSGDSNPSIEDIETTRSILEQGRELGIYLQDHIIIAKGSYFSLKENKLI